MTIVDREEVGVVAEVLEHAAGILTFLFLRARSHQAGDVHFDALEREYLVLDTVGSLVLLFLFLGFARTENAQKVHRNLNVIFKKSNKINFL
jgi:hypothetical protein